MLLRRNFIAEMRATYDRLQRMVYSFLPGLKASDHQLRRVPKRANTCLKPQVDPKRRERLRSKMRHRLHNRLRNLKLSFYGLCMPMLLVTAMYIINQVFDVYRGSGIPGGRAEGVAIGALILGCLLSFAVLTDIHATKRRLYRLL